MTNNNDEKEPEQLGEDRGSYEILKDFQRISSYVSEPSWKFLGKFLYKIK